MLLNPKQLTQLNAKPLEGSSSSRSMMKSDSRSTIDSFDSPMHYYFAGMSIKNNAKRNVDEKTIYNNSSSRSHLNSSIETNFLHSKPV